MALSSTPRPSVRGAERGGCLDPGAGGRAAAGSKRGGNAGTHVGGSASTASAALPGQLHSPTLSNHRWVRDVFAEAGIQEIQRTLVKKPKPCTNLPKHAQQQQAIGRRGPMRRFPG
jgi:hypothetical protein